MLSFNIETVPVRLSQLFGDGWIDDQFRGCLNLNYDQRGRVFHILGSLCGGREGMEGMRVMEAITMPLNCRLAATPCGGDRSRKSGGRNSGPR